MAIFHQAKSYLSYWLNAVEEHSLQAPFIYSLYNKVIKPAGNISNSEIEHIRKQFEKSNHTIEVTDYGAGSKVERGNTRKISAIALKGITSKKGVLLLERLIQYLEAKNIIELGTSLGITSLYLSNLPGTTLTTFEGADSLANIAQEVFEGLNRRNITVIEGDIDITLPEFLAETLSKPDLIYFDANHQYESTLSYFHTLLEKSHDKTCFVFDDIHLSPGMEKAWQEIKAHYRVTLSIDLYQMGIVFINPEFIKHHYVLEF